jgi:hypothetical protein
MVSGVLSQCRNTLFVGLKIIFLLKQVEIMMLNFLHSYLKAGKTLVLLTALCLSFSINASGNIWGLLGKDFTGTIIDHETKEPIEGAYVMAIYSIVRSGPAATTTWCVKTKGMTTGKDGKYRFPIAELNGLPPEVSVIKHDYVFVRNPIPKAWHENSWSEAAYQGWNIYLKKRDANTPDPFGEQKAYCEYADSREDAVASLIYLKIRLEEYTKYPSKDTLLHKQRIDVIQQRIRKLEALPSKSK